MKKKTIISLILVVLLVTCTVSPALAGVQASQYLDSYLAYIVPVGDGDLEIWFDVRGTDVLAEIGTTKIEMQVKTSSTASWTTIKTFTKAMYPQMLGSNVQDYINHVDYYGTAGYSYQAYVTIYGGDGSSGDSRTVLTSAVTAI